jgi:PAS domain S-box-containing protein
MTLSQSSCVAIAGGLDGLSAYRTGLDVVDAAIALADPSGEIIYRNPACDKLELDLYAQDTCRPADRGYLGTATVRQAVVAACDARQRGQLPVTLYLDRNIPVSLTLVITPLLDAGDGRGIGAMIGFREESLVHAGRDLAARQLKNLELTERIRTLAFSGMENERLVRLLLAEVPVPLVIFDSDCKVVQINRAAEKLFGVNRRDAVGHACTQYLHCHAQDGCCPVLDRQESMQMSKISAITPSSLNRYLLRTAVPMQEQDNRMVLEVFIDITERKQVEQQLERYRYELENIVAERTAKLEHTVEELDRFSYSVSHDLRSPLRAINGFSQAIIDEYGDRLDETAMAYLARMRNASARMGQLIDDLLALSQIGRREIKRRQVDVSAMAAEITAEMQQAEPQHAVTVQVEPGLTTFADEGLLRILLTNLIANARKFTRGVEAPRIDIHGREIEGQRVFCVRDNGIGFPMEFYNKLFLPFHVLHPGTAMSGSGIGLATAQRIVHRHDGTIWAQSAPDLGTSFFFMLGEAADAGPS